MLIRDRLLFVGAAGLWGGFFMYPLIGGGSYDPGYGYAPEWQTILFAAAFAVPVLLPALLPRKPGTFSLVLLSSSCIFVFFAALALILMTSHAWFSGSPKLPIWLISLWSVTSLALLLALFVGIRQHLQWSIRDARPNP
jgi:hypothetical protein